MRGIHLLAHGSSFWLNAYASVVRALSVRTAESQANCPNCFTYSSVHCRAEISGETCQDELIVASCPGEPVVAPLRVLITGPNVPDFSAL